MRRGRGARRSVARFGWLTVASAGFVLIVLASTSSAAAPKNRCLISSIKHGAHDLLAAQGACYNQAGQKVGSAWSTSYEQFDYAKQGCNVVPETEEPGMISGPNVRDFTPKLVGTYSVKVTFTLRAKATKGVKATNRTASFTLGHTSRLCGQMDGLNSVPTSMVCNPDNNDYTNFGPGQMFDCGSLYTSGYQGPELPQWSGMSLLINGVVYTPPLNDMCTEDDGNYSNFWGVSDRAAFWRCGKVAVLAFPIVHYISPAGNPSCPAVLSSGAFDMTHFALPNGWQGWGGQLIVVWREEIDISSQEMLEYSVSTFKLKANGTNACPEFHDLRG